MDVKAVELGKRQREISVAEFFEKNRQILGFDSPQRSLVTCVKEAVDNSLDACEDAEVLPDIFVQIKRIDKDFYRISVEDNGPGIVKKQIPKIFGKLLYGSRFHLVKQSRGQQGIGISACVLYAQLTTGKPAKILSKTDPKSQASYFELMIDTRKNDARILLQKNVLWERAHGLKVELEIKGAYVRGKKSVLEYLRGTSIVNPHARILLVEPDGNEVRFERAMEELPARANEVKPHPQGIELGNLLKMLDNDSSLSDFLCNEFARIGKKTSEEICSHANLDPARKVSSLSIDDARRIISAFKNVKILAPPSTCLSPLGENIIFKGLQKDRKPDFISVSKRSASAHAGHPFVVEVGIAYGGERPKDEKVEVLRFANRVPLLYQPGACAILHAIEKINWKNYGLEQSPHSTPVGPASILVHLASTNIPFVSEAKDAIADVPEILLEVELALREAGRNLKNFLARKNLLEKRKGKEEMIHKILPEIAKKVSSILNRETPDISCVLAKVMGNLLVQKKSGYIRIVNNSSEGKKFTLVATAHKVRKKFHLSLGPGEEKLINFPAKSFSVEGIEREFLTYA